MMKIAISSTGRDLDAQVDARFGRCLCFIVVDPATEGFEVLENTAAGNTGGAGVQAAQIVANAGVKVVLTGNLGPNAAQVLEAAGVQVHTGASGTVREVLQQHQGGGLQAAAGPAPGPTAAAPGGGRPAAMAAGRGGGMGRGGGRGMGRGGGRRGGGGFGAGPGGDCVCPACGERTPHRPGMPCFEARCPKCGAAMIRP
jgi:predicted Fe-Mo cluster-binding NifX family protein